MAKPTIKLETFSTKQKYGQLAKADNANKYAKKN